MPVDMDVRRPWNTSVLQGLFFGMLQAMPLTLYNTLTNTEEEFVPLKTSEATVYTCGPTVYSRPHIGNYSSFLMADLLVRWLEHGHSLTVKHVKNITDVGHLVADRDEGEDKIEKQARQESGEVTAESVLAIAKKYTDQYLEDEKALNMREPQARPRATQYIDQMKAMIDDLLQKDIAYVTEDGIYYDVTKADHYGKLSGNTLDKVESGARVKVDERKKHPADFALWKFCIGANEHHVLRWPSPGKNNPEGFPGWHIECSAMSRALLGDRIDIHTGGEDNIFPHHECEIAQSESVTNKKPFVKLWLHRRRIDMGKEKMSKSLGNVLSLDDIIKMGYSAGDLRYYLLSVHYRTNLKFTEKGLSDAHKARRKILEWMQEVQSSETLENKGVDTWSAKFSAAMDHDLNAPEALAVIFDLMTSSRKKNFLGACRPFVKIISDTFGCFDSETSTDIPSDVQKLLDDRKRARDEKDFTKSDELRDAIRALGYEVRDQDGKQTVKKL